MWQRDCVLFWEYFEQPKVKCIHCEKEIKLSEMDNHIASMCGVKVSLAFNFSFKKALFIARWLWVQVTKSKIILRTCSYLIWNYFIQQVILHCFPLHMFACQIFYTFPCVFPQDSIVICNVTKSDRWIWLLEIGMALFWEITRLEEISRCLETLALVLWNQSEGFSEFR